MKIRVSPAKGAKHALHAIADSSARTTVVPTATTRPPRARVAPHLLDQGRAHVQPFAVHAVFAHIIHAHRLEGARAHVQGDVAEFDALFAQRLQQRLVEMQAGGRRRHRAELAREHGLVTLVVVDARFAVDVGRKRQAPCFAAASFPASRRRRNAAGRTRRRAPQLQLRHPHPTQSCCPPSATCLRRSARVRHCRAEGARSVSRPVHRCPSGRRSAPGSPACR